VLNPRFGDATTMVWDCDGSVVGSMENRLVCVLSTWFALTDGAISGMDYMLSKCLAFLLLFAVATADGGISCCICPRGVSRNSDNYVESFLVQCVGVKMSSRVSAPSAVLLSLVPMLMLPHYWQLNS